MEKVEFKRVQLKIEGMTCGACVAHIEKGIKKLDGIGEVAINLATELARIDYDPAEVKLESIVQAISTAGYAVGEESEAKQ